MWIDVYFIIILALMTIHVAILAGLTIYYHAKGLVFARNGSAAMCAAIGLVTAALYAVIP